MYKKKAEVMNIKDTFRLKKNLRKKKNTRDKIINKISQCEIPLVSILM